MVAEVIDENDFLDQMLGTSVQHAKIKSRKMSELLTEKNNGKKRKEKPAHIMQQTDSRSPISPDGARKKIMLLFQEFLSRE